jgi:hypothetical protein
VSIKKKLEQSKCEFSKGLIPLERLLLYIEPLLMQVVHDAEDKLEVKKIVNGIERAIYTQIEPQRSKIIEGLIDQSISFVTLHEID